MHSVSGEDRPPSGQWSMLRTVCLLGAITAVFALMPWTRLSVGKAPLLATTFGLGMVGAALLVYAQVRGYRRAARMGRARLRGLLVALYLAVLFFATAFYVLQLSQPTQFTGVRTRLDAVYFALSVLSTVGFGDVHADGQAARAIVSAQIVFNLLVVSLAVAAVRNIEPLGPPTP